MRPKARGTGLARALIEARIAVARDLGLRNLVADTFRGNAPMIRLYRAVGVEDAPAYGSAVARILPELIPHLQFFRMTL
ncbi:GNAT family N-acetyltransferase [Jannaschia sp. M317]|uniref:GNAT family N-acetyltransferase n=1 Tax=Jannaschia sp. M317 TaxID=2867011 RepID=UPI0021A477A6|nr:GNAT family N-acetyltransferase [Jannaschia sp. M317]UWQ19244.1 GNAT family N-acetyltransferase [Jannaschia sp. M317]